MMHVFCINGVALAGKDSFTQRVAQCLPTGKIVKTVSTIDPVKKIYKEFFGWDGTKTPVHRKNLNMLKMLWVKTSDGPMRYLENIITHNQYIDMLFVMVREFEEMEKSKNLALSLGCNAYTLEVVRDGLDIPPIEQEFLDSHPKDYTYDFTIYNPTVNSFPHLPALDTAAISFAAMF